MSERTFDRRQLIPRLASSAVDTAVQAAVTLAPIVEDPSVITGVGLGVLAAFSLRVKVAEAARTPAVVSAPVREGCGTVEPSISVPDFDTCVGPDQAAIYATSLVYKNTNGLPKFQNAGEMVDGKQVKGDQVVGLMVGATYRMTNTSNPAEAHDVVINDKGEVSRTVNLPDGKQVEQVLFIFNGEPNSLDVDGKPAIRIQFQRYGAWDKTLNKYVQLGDSVYADSAVACTALNFGLRLPEDYLGPKDSPKPTNKPPVPPPALPPVQIPSGVPSMGDGSTPTEPNPNIPRWPGH